MWIWDIHSDKSFFSVWFIQAMMRKERRGWGLVGKLDDKRENKISLKKEEKAVKVIATTVTDVQVMSPSSCCSTPFWNRTSGVTVISSRSLKYFLCFSNKKQNQFFSNSLLCINNHARTSENAAHTTDSTQLVGLFIQNESFCEVERNGILFYFLCSPFHLAARKHSNTTSVLITCINMQFPILRTGHSRVLPFFNMVLL